jgi:hypothetical protein
MAAVQRPGGTTVHLLFSLGMDEQFTGSFLVPYRAYRERKLPESISQSQ